jgi:hypothetical protein
VVLAIEALDILILFQKKKKNGQVQCTSNFLIDVFGHYNLSGKYMHINMLRVSLIIRLSKMYILSEFG